MAVVAVLCLFGSLGIVVVDASLASEFSLLLTNTVEFGIPRLFIAHPPLLHQRARAASAGLRKSRSAVGAPILGMREVHQRSFFK